MSLSNTIKLKGLYTFGNELNTSDGSLRVAENVNIDEPNTITKRRGFVDFASRFGDSDNDKIRQIMSYKNVPIAYFKNNLHFYNDSIKDFSMFDGTYFEVSDDIRFKYLEANGNFYFTTSEAIKKISATSSKQFSTSVGYITNAGIPEALDGETKIIFTPTGFLPPQSKTAYKILFGKKDTNNVLNLGASTSRMVVTNTSKDIYTYERFNLIFKSDEDFKAQRTTITCPVKADIKHNTIASGVSDAYILVENAKNKNKYQFYFKKDALSIAPNLVSGATQVEVDITSATTAEEVATALELASINASLTEITTQKSNTAIIYTNTLEGSSNGVTFNNVGTTPTTWTKTDNIVGTDSKYIEKYFKVHTLNENYCVYYGNSRTIETAPTDVGLVGYKFIPVLIENTSNKSYIANQTSIALNNNIGDLFDIILNTSGSNPLVQLTDKIGGNIDDVEQGTLVNSNLEVSTITQGDITKGQNANVEVTFTIPQGIDSTFFYRIYRTAYIQVPEGLTLDDIDPGEECNLVYEGSIPFNSQVGDTISVTDITNETFRNSGEYLYNNPLTGSGVLQNNYAPPVSKDITSFKNFTFYGNTRLQHQMTETATSVDNIVSEVSTISVFKGNQSKTYLFVGEASQYSFTTGTKLDTIEHNLSNPNAKFYLYSAMNLTKYVVYFDKGSASIPTDTDAISVRVDLTEILDTDNVKDKLKQSLSLLGDFSIDTTSGFVLTNTENGISTEPHTPNNNWSEVGTGYGVTTNTQGKGEDLALGHILLSKSASVGLKIERTIRSLVKVLNSDADGFVNAYYLSGQNDLPGKFQVKARTNADETFYLVLNGGVGSDFNPELPEIEGNFTGITKNGNQVILTKVSHDFTQDEEVYINLPNSNPDISGVYSVNVIDVDTISINAPDYLFGTVVDSSYFFPFEKSDNLYSPNRIYFSKLNQPEAVPLVNYLDIGAKDDPIERIVALRDFMFILKTDGIYVLSGDNGVWNVRMQDTEIILCPDSAVVLNNQIYMVTNSGVVTINENTPVIISRMIENKFQEFYNYRDLVRKLGFGVSYRDDRAYIFWLPTEKTDTACTRAFRYNYLEQEWTTWTTGAEATCGLVIGSAKTELYIGTGNRPQMMKERKNLDPYRLRIDYCDRDFGVELGIDSVIRNNYRLSSVEDVEADDSIVQIQYLNIQFFNRFLRKLDDDSGIPYDQFFNSFECKTGYNLASLLNSVSQKLVEIDTQGTVVYRQVVNTDWVDMQEKFNLLMGDLNNPNSMSVFRDYSLSEGTVEYEYVIRSVNIGSNEITLVSSTSEFIQGDLTVYKRIVSVVEANPIHFGNPSSLKQINQGYLLSDQNNYYKMKLEYKTDLSPYFEGISYFGKNPGYWNYGDYGWDNKNYFGGDGSDAPKRTIIPRNKQRCRYISVKFEHSVARDYVKIVGVAHNVREVSEKAYK